MISLDKAEKLKELGLKWNPLNGDEYWHDNEPLVFCHECTSELIKEHSTWLPKLDQLLNKIEELGYNPRLEKWDDEMYECDPCIDGISNRKNAVIGKSWEDAIADVLIYILKQHKN